MTNKKNFIKSMLSDESGNVSSKRFVGIVAGLSLCITMYANSYSHGDIKPADSLVNAVAMLSFGCLGLASVDKVFGKKLNNNKTETE
jgi:hypothetical protein